jgi:hypothetical protein
MNLDATINIEQSIKQSPMTSSNNNNNDDDDNDNLLSSSNLSIDIQQQHQMQQKLITRELIKQENVILVNVRD